MTKVITNPTSTTEQCVVSFDEYKDIEPKDLISFSPEYVDHLPFLKQHLKDHVGKQTSILLARIDHNGFSKKKKIVGLVREVKDDNFTFYTDQNFFYQSDDAFDLHIRFENVLGDVPLLTSAEKLKPFNIDSSTKFNQYFKFLEEAKEVMQSAIGTVHSAWLYYRYDELHPTLRNGNYYVQCEVVQVNKSNVLLKHFRTFAYVDKHHRYVDIVPGSGTDRFVAFDRYLQKVVILFGAVHQINGADEEDWSE